MANWIIQFSIKVAPNPPHHSWLRSPQSLGRPSNGARFPLTCCPGCETVSAQLKRNCPPSTHRCLFVPLSPSPQDETEFFQMIRGKLRLIRNIVQGVKVQSNDKSVSNVSLREESAYSFWKKHQANLLVSL